MRNLLYRAIKISIAVLLAVVIAEFLHLDYPITAGVFAMLSILDSRRQTYIVGLKRLMAAGIAIVLSFVLFHLGGFDLWILGIFVVLFVPIVTLLKVTEGLIVSTVLVTHIYALESLTIHAVANEIGLILIGVLIAWAINLHMPNVEKDIHELQLETEEQIKSILRKMSLQLINQCSIDEQHGQLVMLNQLLQEGKEKALQYNNNYMLKDYSYYIHYFQMRRQQYEVLVHMEKIFEQIFIGVPQAQALSEFTEQLALGFSEKTTGMKHLKEIESLEQIYRDSELPKTRAEFENRARLYQYLNDIKYLIEIKVDFVEAFSGIYKRLSSEN